MQNTSRFVWHDLNTTDVEAAKRFYGELFGWSFEDSENNGYCHISSGEEMIGGLRRREEGEHGPPSWLGYVLVDDVPAAVERVGGGGGQVYMPATTMPDVGTFAVVADPSGGVVAPWRSAREGENDECGAMPAVHAFCWDELLSTDPAAAGGFYSRVFGWGVETRDMGEAGEYTLFNRPGVPDPMRDEAPAWAAGMMQSPPGVPYSFWLAYVRVEDTDATAKRAESLGATLIAPPMEIEGVGRFCSFMDPQGAALAVITFPDA